MIQVASWPANIGPADPSLWLSIEEMLTIRPHGRVSMGMTVAFAPDQANAALAKVRAGEPERGAVLVPRA